MYMDGANLNALLGIVQPGKIGFDLMHLTCIKPLLLHMEEVAQVQVR